MSRRLGSDLHVAFDLPEEVSYAQACALMLAGVCAWHVLRTHAGLRTGDAVVVHAGAGSVGSTAIQLARAWGAGRIIALASSPEKRELTKQLGADVAIDSRAPYLAEATRAANDGELVDVILEVSGGEVFDASLEVLAPFGRLVYYESASRTPATRIVPESLMRTGRSVSGFWLTHCRAHPALLHDAMAGMLKLVGSGELRPLVGKSYPLSEARRAHEDLLTRATIGKLVLDPRDVT